MDPVAARSTLLPRVIADALARGVTILTPNQRVAHELRHAFDTSMSTSGARQWTPPRILALDSWAADLWHRLVISGSASALLLNRTQELSLWRRILAEDPEVSSLRSPESLAEMASSAWHLLCTYKGLSRLHEVGISTDTRAFQRWSRSFEQALRKEDLITAGQLPSVLQQLHRTSPMPIPKAGLLLVDFDLMPPAFADLLGSLRASGFEVAEHITSIDLPVCQQYGAPDELTELEVAALWIRRSIEDSSQCRIAVIVPNLADRRTSIARVFGQILAPELELITQNPGLTGPFEFSLGRPLAETSVVVAALDLLRWTFEPLPTTSVSELLLSPFFGASDSRSEQLSVAEFDATELRRLPLLRPELSLEVAVRLMENSTRRSRLAPVLHRLKALRHAANKEKVESKKPRTHGDWAEFFRSLLDAAGWLRASNATSIAFQTQRRFDSALDEFVTLDFDGSRIDAPEALATLTQMTRHIIFAPESRNAPIQIMGPLEAGGVPFDILWFLGAGDLGWPQPTAFSPLLPWQLQRSLGIPGADAAMDRTAARTLTKRLAGSATQVVFSFAHHVADGEQRASPALADLSLAPVTDIPEKPSHAPLPMQEVEDDCITPPPPDRVMRGGAQILQAQAACAFRAFAEHRLRSDELESRANGLDALERGSLVHAVMERFWNRVEDQPSLLKLTREEADAVLEECISFALGKLRSIPQTLWDAAYLRTQRLRLTNLLRPWIELERGRPPFAVSHSEKRLNDVPLGPLRLSLRVDRIDETESGPVILDYKTGLARPAEWLTERPDAPQLPLYAILSAEPVAGVAFALLRAGDDLGLKGFANSPAAFGKPVRMNLGMEEQLHEWRRILVSLAESFYAGDARPDPKSYPKTCSYCSQRILCRLDPSTLHASEDDDPSDQEGARD